MLDKLDSVAWPTLTHAYGDAADVPDQIRALASQDQKTREQAIWSLYGNIFHQGTRYQATPYAVPFLYELAASPAVQDRGEIVELLVHLAVSYEEDHLPDGFDPAAFRATVEREEAEMDDACREECDKFGFGPRVDLDCYEAVARFVPDLIALLDSDNEKLRRTILYALAWFPEYAVLSIPAVRLVLDSGADDALRTNGLLTLGLLGRSANGTVDEAYCRAALSAAALPVRVAAAIALAREPLPDDVVGVLIEAVQSGDQISQLRDTTSFYSGNLKGYAAQVLSRYGMDDREAIVPVLCRTLQAVDPYQSLTVTRSLLELVAGEGRFSFRDRPANTLDPLTLEALHAIAEHGGWNIAGGVFANYGNLIMNYGLPATQEELAAYLASA